MAAGDQECNQTCVPATLGLLILVMSLATFASPPQISKVSVEENLKRTSEFAGDATGLMGAQTSKGSCLRETGGTCFVTGCSPSRGNVSCEVEHSYVGRLGWHTCNCQDPTPCAHSDGMCHALPESTWAEWLKEKDRGFALLAIAPVMRSGVSKLISAFFAVDHLMGFPADEPLKKINFIEVADWTAVKNQANFNYWFQPVLVSGVKLFVFHLPQPLLFILPYAAYFDAMGWVQRIFGALPVCHEFTYLYLIGVGLRKNRKWLLYAPTSDVSSLATDGRMTYFTAPSVFIADCLNIHNSRTSMFIGIFSIASVLGSWVSIAVGLVGVGVMSPTLLIGYLLSGGGVSFALLRT